MASMFCSTYEFQIRDLKEDKVSLANSQGRLLCDDATELCPIVANALGTLFQALRTTGDGACAIHAVWGSSHITGDLTYVASSGDLRSELYTVLPETFAEVRRILETSQPELIENIETLLWNELAHPGARRQGDSEAALFWNTLQHTAPDFATYIQEFLLQKEHDTWQRRRDLDNFQRACNTFFQQENEETLVRPFLAALQVPEFPVDLTSHSRYSKLFSSHGEPTFDILRRSVLDFAWNEKKQHCNRSSKISETSLHGMQICIPCY